MVTIQSQTQLGTSQTFYGPTIILFILIALLFGILFRELNKKFKLPYSPLLILLGLLLGNIHQYLGSWGQGVANIQAIHPHSGMSIFVPTLVFTGALGTNFYMFKKSLVNILILSIPGVILGSLLFGFVFKVILGYDDNQMNWIQATTLGCALTSTDPVALVALLKEFESTSKLNTLLEGESLVSGAFSMILYYVMIGVMNNEIKDPLEFTVASVRLAAGGICVGLLFGIIISFWMKRIIKDQSLSIVITIVGSYLSFYLCEFTWLKFGGVAAVVTQGLYLSTVVKRKIYHQSEQALDTVWSTMVFSGQAVLFILIGSISGIQFVRYDTLTTNDYVKMFLFWGLMIVVRFIVVYAFSSILQSRGYGLSKKQLVILIYGGLKGGIGLSLAMMITADPYYPLRFRHLATLYMEGMVLMTVIVNGLTCKRVVEFVQIIHVPQIKLILLKKCIKEVLVKAKKKFQNLQLQTRYKKADWNEVENLAKVYELGETVAQPEQKLVESQLPRDSFREIHPIDLKEQIRFRFNRYLNKTYWDIYKQGELSQEAIRILSSICDIANDNSQTKLAYYESVEGAFSLQTANFYFKFKKIWLLGLFFSRMLASKIYFLYEVSATFVQGCEETISVFQNDFPMSNQSLNEVLEQAKQNIDLFFAFIGQIQSSFPELIRAAHTRRAASIVLRNKRNILKKIYEEGFIDQRQYDELKTEIEQNLLSVNYLKPNFRQINANDVLLIYPLFSSLSTPQIESIKKKSLLRIFSKDAIIIDKDRQFNELYVILSGAVRQEFENFHLIKSAGNVINPYDFIWKKNSRCKATTLNQVKVMQIKPQIIDQFLQTNFQFKKKWYRSLFIYELNFNKNITFLKIQMSEKLLRRFIEDLEIILLKSGQKEYSYQGMFLFEGQIKIGNKVYSPTEGLIPKQKEIQALKDCILLKFNKILQSNVDSIRVLNYTLDQDDF